MPDRYKLYFASDFHLGAPNYAASREREDRIVRWLDMIKADAAEVFLMGDVFDFWFEYTTVVPKGYIRFLGKLAELADAGIKIYMFKGNHDMWMFEYFTNEFGAIIIDDELEIERGGQKFYLHHGDGLGPGDAKYKLLKNFFRSKLCQWLFERIHPNLGVGIANRWSRTSRINGSARPNKDQEQEWLVQYCRDVLQTKYFDNLIFGHRHVPLDIQLNEKSRYINLGEWVNYFSYAVLMGKNWTLNILRRVIECKSIGWIIALLFIIESSFAGTVKPDYIKIVQVPGKQRVDIMIGGELFTSLLYADSLKKPTLYPIYTAKQNMVTRGWPLMPKHMDRTDYSHQFGLWFNYGNVNGADYWNNAVGADTTKRAYGYIKLQKISAITSGEGKASMTMQCKWINPGSKAMLEETSVFVFKVEHGLRIIDRYITLKALTNVDFKDDKQGLYGFRAATELGQPVTSLETAMLADNDIKTKNDSIPLTGRFTNSEGIQGEAVFAKRAKWMKLVGLVNKEPVTLIMMDHPQNVNYPSYWLARSYGLMSINPFGAEVFTGGKEKANFSLAKGKLANFRYRFVQGGNDLDAATLDKLYSDFSADGL